MLFERMTYHLIKYNETAPWWRSTTYGREGMLIGAFLGLWGMAISGFVGLYFFMDTNRKVFMRCLFLSIALLVVGILLGVYLTIKQNKGKIENTSGRLSDRTAKIMLAVFIFATLALALMLFFILYTHYRFHWFSFMD